MTVLPENVIQGAQTVVDVAAHFDGLKRAALKLLETPNASQRGYFTPEEDEEIRHLLVSYWQSRNAVIEVVRTSYFGRDGSATHRPAEFLVAWAGALILIDAARFLRDHIHDRSYVRKKLNESEPHFGIPMGTYDRIQESLTRPLHVWHLYHAARYFEDHRDELEGFSQSHDPLQSLWPVIDAYQDRVNVSLSDYTLARTRVRARQFVTTVRRDLLYRAMYGLQKAVLRSLPGLAISFTHEPALPGPIKQQLQTRLRPGDVLVTRKEYALTNYFLPGFWPHAALYLGEPDELLTLGIAEHKNVQPRWQRLLECDASQTGRVLEALKDGVWIRSVACPFRSDAIVVIRPLLDETRIAQAISRGLFHDGKPYDFDFDFTRSDRLVCTEVVYRSYNGVGGMQFKLSRRAGRMTLAAEDLLNMAIKRDCFETVALFSPAHSSELLQGDRAVDVLIHTTS